MEFAQFFENLFYNDKDYSRAHANRTRAFYNAEKIIMNILTTYLKQNDKEFQRPRYIDKRFQFDGYIPDGFDDLPGATVVEIKMYSNKRNYRLSKIYSNLNELTADSKIKSILLVFVSKFDDNEKKALYNHINQQIRKIKFKIMDLDDLSKIYDKVKDQIEFSQLSDNNYRLFYKEKLDETINKSLSLRKSDLNKIKKERLNDLKKAYEKDDLVLFLGAGTSKDANIVDWSELISDLLVKMIEKKFNKNSQIMKKEEINFILNKMNSLNEKTPLLQARYIKTGLGDDFEKTVADILYKNIKLQKGYTSQLLKEIANICVPRRNGIGVKAIVTYNFDDLIEHYLKNTNIDFHSIYREGEYAIPDELGIFHVHGFLPREPEKYENLSKSLLIFSEDGYHELYNDPYSWSNLTQLNFLRENTCIMVGLSLTDPNLRRLLEIAHRKNEIPKHYAILKKQNLSESNTKKNIREEIVTAFEITNQELQEKYFEELGIQIIWIDDYNQIPNFIKQIRRRNSH